MQLGVISDIHSNYPALETVLAHMNEHYDVDKIVCVGDILGLLGPPNRVIDLVRESADYAIVGNHDTRVLPGRGYIPSSTSQKREHQLITDNITDENHEWLAGLPTEIELSDGVRVAHARPEAESESGDPTGGIEGGAGVPPRRFTQLSPDGGVIVLGHTHEQHTVNLSRFDGKDGVVLNPGAVGYPYSDGIASYAVLDADTQNVVLERVEYDSRPVTEHVRRIMGIASPDRGGGRVKGSMQNSEVW